jgi:hypothetical protein
LGADILLLVLPPQRKMASGELRFQLSTVCIVANNGVSTVSAFNANITAANVNSVFISAVATVAAPESIVVVGHP